MGGVLNDISASQTKGHYDKVYQFEKSDSEFDGKPFSALCCPRPPNFPRFGINHNPALTFTAT